MKLQTTPLLLHIFICVSLASIQEKAQRIFQHNPQLHGGSADPVNALSNHATGPALKKNAQVKAALIDFLQASTASIASTAAPATSSTSSAPVPSTSATTTASGTNPPTNENLGSSPTPTASSPYVSTTSLTPFIIGIIVFASVAFVGIMTAAVIYYRRRLSPNQFSKLHPSDSSIEPMIAPPKAEGYRGVPYLPLMNPMKLLKAKKVLFQYTAANADELSLEIGELVDVTEVVDENFARGVVLRSGKEGVFPRICVEKF
ncbi:hypothetical protein HDU81_005712 [Chytriomyces hyalinus]|nr:hypothetical protein HDU81_005712 [Chytriomyces hyalinus]